MQSQHFADEIFQFQGLLQEHSEEKHWALVLEMKNLLLLEMVDQKRRNMMLCAGDGWKGRDMKVWGTKMINQRVSKGGERDSEPFAWDMPMSRIWERDATLRIAKCRNGLAVRVLVQEEVANWIDDSPNPPYMAMCTLNSLVPNHLPRDMRFVKVLAAGIFWSPLNAIFRWLISRAEVSMFETLIHINTCRVFESQ
ncbi:hypothetical protein AVEN_15048-1 [Araneus ventricosus]|uniref:Uncharacterized protein n=1 Tax=Araneus ventricosus TaxID=182803 RepID=A0A4Y2QCD1_ARAVE|nr:hypothetical protein AVEN_15048-1 [Araneus ventricosus]